MPQVSPALVPIYAGTPRFVDSTGQRVLLRGVNVQAGAGTSIYQKAVDIGANMVRISLHWSDGETSAPQGSGTNWGSYTHAFNASYLGGVETMVQYYQAHGLYVQIDSHQAGWSPVAPFNGFGGIPGWYYTDARFPGKATLSGCSQAASCAISNWWTSAAEKAANQTFYAAWWAELVRRFSAYDNVIMYQVFNEPNPGGMGGSSLSKVTTMQQWLAPIVNGMRSLDANRAIAVMNRGGGQGYGTADYSAFGGAAGLQAKKMVIEHHSYYTGLSPGFPADPTKSGQVGYNGAGDDYVPDAATTHNTTANSSYHGNLAAAEAYYSVPINKAKAMGVPLFLGEFGVNNTDPGRLTYIAQQQQLMDAFQLDGTVWLLANTTGSNSLNLLTSGAFNDMGTAWQTWFKATDTTPGTGGGGGGTGGGGGGGGGTGGGTGGTISTSPAAAGSTPGFYDPTFTLGSHAGRVEDILIVNNVIYVAGRFGHVIDVDGTDYGTAGANAGPYQFLAAFRADTGALIKTWRPNVDGEVRQLLLGSSGNFIYAVGNFTTFGGSTRHGVARFAALTGPGDTTAAAATTNPSSSVNPGGNVWAITYASNTSGVTDIYLGGDWANGLEHYTIDGTGAWVHDTSWTGHPGSTVRALILSDNQTKLVAGGNFTGGMAAFNAATGAASTWGYVPGNSPGVFSLDSAANRGFPGDSICYVGGGAGSGDILTAVDFGDGGGPNNVSPVGNCEWYRRCDGNVQVVRVGQFGGQLVVFAGHHGDNVAKAKNVGLGTNQTSHGLFSCIAGTGASGGGADAGYGGPPNFTSPGSDADPLKLWAIEQDPSSLTLFMGGDFNSVNTAAQDAYLRFAQFNGAPTSSGWNPTPSLSDSTPQVGETLTCDHGILTGAVSYAFQWAHLVGTSWQAISGATSSSYTVVSGDSGLTIRCRVDGTLADGSVQTAFATATSATQPAGSAPINTTPPTISPSSGAVGTTFTATTHAADWSPTTGVTFTYQWQRRNPSTGIVSNIPGATSSTYVSTSADSGTQIQCVITATKTSDGSTGQAPTPFATVGTISTSAVIWCISDAGSSSHAAAVLANNIPLHGTGVDLVVYLGDIYARGTSADEGADITALYGPSGRDVLSKLIVLCGNHDWANRACAGGYRDYIRTNLPKMAGMLPDGIGKINLAGVDLVFLNDCVAAQTLTGDCTESAALLSDGQVGLGAAQVAQLQTWMAAPGTNKLVFSHHQRFSAGQNHGDIPSNQPMWAALQPAAYGANGGTLAHIHGHEHDYQRLRPRDATGLVATDAGFKGPGVVEYCCGDGGEGNYDKNASYPAKYIASFRGNSTAPVYGALRITISGNTITFDHFAEDGVTITDTSILSTAGAQGSSPSASPGPSIVGLTGAPVQGQLLTADSGAWSGDTPMDFAFQFQHSFDSGGTWQNCTGSGNSATVTGQSDGNAQASYAAAASDVGALLRCRVVATNDVGSVTGFTAATQAATAAPSGSGHPVLTSAPVLTPNIAAIGIAVSTTNGVWSNPTGSGLTYTYQWYRVNPTNGSRQAITGATASTYTATSREVGFRLQVDVTATNTGTGSGPTTASSNMTAPIVSSSISVTVQIDSRSGQTIQVGQPFTVVWEAHTNAPGGIIGTLVRLDGGAWQQGTQIDDDGAGGGTYEFTFATLPLGPHTIDVEALANGS